MTYAHVVVANALKRGKLERQPCEVCGMEPGLTRYRLARRTIEYQNVVAHHDDYNKPLEVRWLCKRHHADHHKATGSYVNNGRRRAS